MNFKEYLSNAWMTHETDARKLLDEVKDNFKLMESEDDVMAMARLIVHLAGQHLGDWESGIGLLRKLKNNATINDKSEMNRLVAVLTLGNFPSTDLSSFSPSDQARIYAATSSALASLGGIKNAEKFLKLAVNIIETNLSVSDPANKAVAITGNTIASTLEEKTDRSILHDELMIYAAQTARKYWEIAGGWKEIERAEYRLAKSNLKAQRNNEAHEAACTCLKIVNSNNDEPLELFFAQEVVILTSMATNNISGLERSKEVMRGAFDQLSTDDQEWCRPTLDLIEKL
jgi:hypothetical protein